MTEFKPNIEPHPIAFRLDLLLTAAEKPGSMAYEQVETLEAEIIAEYDRLVEQYGTLHEALTVIAERRVPTTFGGGHGAVVNYARKTLAALASNPAKNSDD